MSFTYFKESLDILSHHKTKNNEDKLIQLHFDEKWIFNDYIKKFLIIEPSESELISFIKEIIKKKKGRLIVTTGFNLPYIIEKIKPLLKELKIVLYENLSFSQLEDITSKSNILISCHGAISHLAAAYNIRQIDIIDKSYNYGKWTDHFRNYKFLYRDNFNKLSRNIIKLI